MTIQNEIEKRALKICELVDKKDSLSSDLKEVNDTLAAHEKELAELLAAEGFAIGSKIALANGRQLAIKDFFSASIPAQSSIDSAKDPEKMEELAYKKDQALKWLDENNLGDIVKNNLVIAFGRGENDKSKKLMEELEEQGLEFIKDESVHPMTLKATLKEALQDGKKVPFDIFSVIAGTIVTINNLKK